jgi:hypothetical protein
MRATRLEELEKLAARLLAITRELPPGQRRYNIAQEIRRFRARITALKGNHLRREHRGLQAKACVRSP